MGNNSDNNRATESGPPQQVNNNHHHNHHQHKLRPRGLMPSDGQDAYRSMRASKRSRNDRLSYLVATGHMDPEETEQLNKPVISDLITTVPLLYSDSPQTQQAPPATIAHTNRAPIRQQQQDNDDIDDSPISHARSKPPSSLSISTKRSNFDPSFLDNLNHTLANSPVAGNSLLQQRQHNDSHQSHEYIFGNSSSSSSNKKGGSKKQKASAKQKSALYAAGNKSSTPIRGGNVYTNHGQGAKHNDRKFRQTFTEVTLPMKTSPAFEYILRDNERRNKRCCLWLLYSTLVTICIAIIIFCSVHLMLRSHNSRN